MKTKVILILVLIFIGKNEIFTQPCSLPQPIVKYNLPSADYHNAELIILNETNYMSNDPHQLRVKIIPVGSLLNGNSVYNPIATYLSANGRIFIAGIDTTINAGSYIAGNFDEGPGTSTKFAFGVW